MPGPEDSKEFKVFDPTLSVYGETPTSATYETSRYDQDFVIPETDLGIALQGMRAANQGVGMELATAAANLVPNIALSLIETTAQLADLEDWSNMIQGNAANYGNALTEWASRNKNQFGEIYRENPDAGFDITDSAWWVSNGAGLVESLVAYGLTGYVVGTTFMKGAVNLSKAVGAYGKAKAGIELSAQLGTSGVLAFTEGAMTGGQVFKDVYTDSYNSKLEELLKQGAEQYGEDNLTEEYQKYAETAADQFAKQVAGEAATTAVRINTGINTFLNLPETGVLFRSMSTSRYLDDALTRSKGENINSYIERIKSFDVNKHLTRKAVTNKVKETVSEGLEEMVNVYAEQEGKNVGREATGQDIMTLGDMLADDDIWAAGFWGAIGGSMNSFVMGKMPKWVTQEDGTKKRTTVGAYTKDQVKDKYQEQLTDLQDRLTEFVDARDAMVKASKSGDERAYKEAADKVFSYNSFNSIVKGTEEQLLNDFQNILGLTAEQASQQGFASDYKERAAEKIQSIRENTKEWNRLQDRYASQDLDQAGFPETIFQQHVNVQNNRKIIQENKIELAKLEAEIAQSYSLRGTDLTRTSFNDVISSINATEHAFEMATIDLENILNLDNFNSKTQKRIIAKLSNMYGNLATAKQEIEKHLEELREQRDNLVNTLEIQKANFDLFIDPEGTMSEEERKNKYANVIAQNTADIEALTEGKKTLETNKKILASQEDELKVLKSDKGLERFKQLKKEKMAERESIDSQAAAKAREQAEAQAQAEKVAAAKAKKKAAPETVTVQEEEIIQAATPVESFEEGNYAGEGSTPDEFKEQFKSISQVADNSDTPGEVIDSSGEPISVGDRLIAGSNKLAYASTVEYVEEGGTLKHTSIKLNPETNPDLLTDKYVPGTKLKIKKLTAEEFKPFIAAKDIEFIDELGRKILVANKGQTVTFEMLSHPYMQPIGIYNEAGEYQAMLHATSYITDKRIVPTNVADDLKELIKIRSTITDQFQEVTINSKSNGKINKLPQFYRLSELINEPVEFAIATSSIQLNTSKTTPVENLANKKGFKVGQVYAITVMPDGRKIAIPVKTTKVKESPQVLTELMTALDAFLQGGSREDLANVFSQYLHSTFSSDKLTSDGNAFEEDPNGKDRFYIDYTSKNVNGIIFGRAGYSKNFISGNSPADSIEVFKKALASIIEESYININFESLKNPDFVKQYVTSDVRFYPLPNGKVTVFDNPVIGFDTSNLLNATAPTAKAKPTPAPVVTPAPIISISDVEAKKAELEAAIKNQEESLKKITIGTPIGGIEGIKVGSKFNQGLKAKVEDNQISDNFDPNVADNDGQGYELVTKIYEYGESKDGKMSKAPKIQVTIFNNKADADAYIEKQKIKIEEYKSKLGTGRNIDRIKEELAALEGKTKTTPQVRTIEEIKNDIAQFRAQEQAEYAAMSDPNDTVEKNRIYTIYDELITPLINEAEADIEKRRQEELEKTNAQLEKIEKNGDSFIRAKVEAYTTLSNEETLDTVEIVTFKDGSRRIRTTDSKTGELILEEKIKKENTTTNEKLIEAFVGNLDNTLKKITEDNNPNKTAVDKINARYDAELAELKQPTVDIKGDIETEIKEVLKNLVLPSGKKPYENKDLLYELEVRQESKNVAKLLSEGNPLTFEFLSDNLGATFTTNGNNVVTVSLNKGTGKIELSEENTVRTIIVDKDNTIDYDFENRGKELSIKNARAISQAEVKYQKYVKDIIGKYNKVQPTEPIIIESSNGVSFTIILDADDDYSITTAEDLEKSVSLQDKVNTLIEEGKATKFCK